MFFHETPLSGAFVLEPQRLDDERGYFARVWCADELARYGLNSAWVQSSESFNRSSGTLRGLHHQREPHGEVKLVRCTSGAVFDVIVDLRRLSASYLRSFTIELSPASGRVLYVPQGFAHGFLTLEEESVVEYHMSEYYQPGSECGVRWDDAAFGIEWPATPKIISDRDRTYADFSGAR